MGYRTPNIDRIAKDGAMFTDWYGQQSCYPKNPEFKKKFGPRGVIHSWANADGTQKIEDIGPLSKNMETVDEETTKAALDFIDKAHEDGKPLFVWWNSTRMHIFTHLKPGSEGKPASAFMPTAWSNTTAWWVSCWTS